MWLCSVNGERNTAYLISVGGNYLVVLVSMVLVSISLVVRGQSWLSDKAVNVRSGVRCAVRASEGLCWSGGVLLMLASSEVFFLLVSRDFIIMKILLFFRWRADLRRVD